ncbi:MAG TPA: hypothetical protein VFN50_05110 [Acidimicrobiales bacterium]|nr:hypothetical protein [Acidimicrobiales bacterium]
MSSGGGEPRPRAESPLGGVVVFVCVLAGALGLGALVARLASPAVHDRYLPWILGRGLGLAAYLTLFSLTMLGLWYRHPLRVRHPVLHPETTLRLHAALASASVVLLTGHLVSLASDSYAGVGWAGALVPGRSAYRTVPVAIGVASFWLLLGVVVSARLGARIGRLGWHHLHQLALLAFCGAFVHGIEAGTDTAALRVGYGLTGLAVVALWWTSRTATTAPHRELEGTGAK